MAAKYPRSYLPRVAFVGSIALHSIERWTHGSLYILLLYTQYHCEVPGPYVVAAKPLWTLQHEATMQCHFRLPGRKRKIEPDNVALQDVMLISYRACCVPFCPDSGMRMVREQLTTLTCICISI